MTLNLIMGSAAYVWSRLHPWPTRNDDRYRNTPLHRELLTSNNAGTSSNNGVLFQKSLSKIFQNSEIQCRRCEIEYGPPLNMDPGAHIPLLNMDPGPIFRGSIFDMTPAVMSEPRPPPHTHTHIFESGRAWHRFPPPQLFKAELCCINNYNVELSWMIKSWLLEALPTRKKFRCLEGHVPKNIKWIHW